VNINQINNIPKFICSERAFFNIKANALDRTYKYIHDGITWRIVLPDISSEIIINSLLSLRSLIVRIGILYLHQSTTRVLFGSGLLLNNQIVLTCAHNFDPINWGDEMIAFKKIYVSSSDPASPDLLSGINSDSSVIEAQIIQRGLKEDNISNLDELKSNGTDLAILKLNHPASHLQFDSFFDPKFSSSSNVALVNCKLFLAGYNGELYDKNDLNAYKYTKGFELLTIDKLNYHHNVDNKSISIGYLIEELSSNNNYGMHNCSTLAGSSGAVIVDSIGRFIGIHIGIVNSRISRKNEFFYTQDTFNKFIHVHSTAFKTFIHEAIIPNINNDQLEQKWKFV
jgi:V8-like Glu-specific endopeptidase